MELFQQNVLKKNSEKNRKKKVILIGIFICVILILFLVALIMYYQDKEAHTFKVYVNDNYVPVVEGFYYNNEEGETYVRAKDIAKIIGWSYQNGEYGAFTEELTSGYIQNGYEVVSFVVGSNKLKKYMNVTATAYTNEFGEVIQPYQTVTPDNNLEVFSINLPIQNNDVGEIYFPLKSLNDICCCTVNFDNPYRMYIYNQEHLINVAQVNAAQFGYQSISGLYENMRLLPYGMMIVSNGSLYGVVDLYSGQNIIGLKYKDMVFIPNVKEFFVKTISKDEESVGIISIDGKQVIPPRNYNNIQILSDELGLYLVEKNGEYGVLNRDGEVVIHCEYESIGIPEKLLNDMDFSVENNKYVLFNNTIIVKADGKYGLCNLDGDQILPTSFVGLGYLVSDDENSAKNSQNVLTIEFDELELINGTKRNIKAIIIQQEVDGFIKYGLYDTVSEKLILPCGYDRIYSVKSKGQTEYYIEFQDLKAKLSDQIAQYPDSFEKISQ